MSRLTKLSHVGGREVSMVELERLLLSGLTNCRRSVTDPFRHLSLGSSFCCLFIYFLGFDQMRQKEEMNRMKTEELAAGGVGQSL